jgi:hypothetical protein
MAEECAVHVLTTREVVISHKRSFPSPDPVATISPVGEIAEHSNGPYPKDRSGTVAVSWAKATITGIKEASMDVIIDCSVLFMWIPGVNIGYDPEAELAG